MIGFDEYQEFVLTVMNPEVLKKKEDMLLNAVLGLNGEAGEVADLVKKWLYHGHELDLHKLKKEICDCQFYVSLAASAVDERLEAIAQLNVDKLTHRYPHGFTVEESKLKRDQHADNTSSTS